MKPLDLAAARVFLVGEAEYNGSDRPALYLLLHLYVSSKSEKKLVIPFHQCEVSFKLPGCTTKLHFDNFELYPARSQRGKYSFITSSIKETHSELIINTSGMICIIASKKSLTEEEESYISEQDIQIIAKLLPVNAERPILIDVLLSYRELQDRIESLWIFERKSNYKPDTFIKNL